MIRRFCCMLLLLSVTSVCLLSQEPTPGTEPAAKPIEITATKYEFQPNEIRVAKGSKVVLKVHSADTTHGIKLGLYPEGSKGKGEPGLVFQNPEQNGRVEKGQDQILEFVARELGAYEFKCAKLCGMGHGRMKGKLIVEE
jgi:cytochrome c oxidase subunit II